MRKRAIQRKAVALTIAGVMSITSQPMQSFAEVIKIENDVQQERTAPEEEISGYELKNNDETVVHNGNLELGSGGY